MLSRSRTCTANIESVSMIRFLKPFVNRDLKASFNNPQFCHGICSKLPIPSLKANPMSQRPFPLRKTPPAPEEPRFDSTEPSVLTFS
ncbi:hypothetical protein SLA2020_110720 [Shorea laevis]